MPANLKTLFTEIANRQAEQVAKWGTVYAKATWTPPTWAQRIEAFTGKVKQETTPMGSEPLPYSYDELVAFREDMLTIAAIALGAIESVDAVLLGENPRPDLYQR